MVSGENMVSPLRISNEYNGLGRYVSWFKRMTTNKYIYHVNNNNWFPFNKRLWQRNYYDHIIRNDKSLNNTRKYIIDNPAKWIDDENNKYRRGGVTPPETMPKNINPEPNEQY